MGLFLCLFLFSVALLPRGVSLALRGAPRSGATWQCLGVPGVVYLPPPETPAASFPHRVFYSLLPALCFCLFTEAGVQQTQPGHRRDLGGESQASQCHVVGAPHVGLERLSGSILRERNPSPSKAGAARGAHVIRSLSPSLEGGAWSSSRVQLGRRGSFYGINQRTQFLSLFPHLCLSEPLPGHWLPGKRI